MHIGFIGCGQLARMMALAGWPMGLKFSFVADSGENTSCVQGLGEIVQLDAFNGAQALYDALGKPDVITVEREHVDCNLLDELAQFCAIHPNPDAIRVAQHRGREKSFLRSVGIDTVDFEVSSSKEQLQDILARVGLPVLLKTCEEGYDGRGQWMLKTEDDVANMLTEAPLDKDLIVEALAYFDREVSVVVARSANGDIASYPLAENTHQNGILMTSFAPAVKPGSALADKAAKIAATTIEKLNYVGVLSIEFFVMGEDLLVNEIAPRVHNSGHWTQAAPVASQFENHMRAIIGSHLGQTQFPAGHFAMVNLLGAKVEQHDLDAPNTQLHNYNKSIRPGRKVGHINLWGEDKAQLKEQAEQLVEQIYAK